MISNALHAEVNLSSADHPTLMQIAAMSLALSAYMPEQLHTVAALTDTHGIRPLELAKLLCQQTLAQEAVAAQ
jgi:hypothetical protein